MGKEKIKINFVGIILGLICIVVSIGLLLLGYLLMDTNPPSYPYASSTGTFINELAAMKQEFTVIELFTFGGFGAIAGILFIFTSVQRRRY